MQKKLKWISATRRKRAAKLFCVFDFPSIHNSSIGDMDLSPSFESRIWSIVSDNAVPCLRKQSDNLVEIKETQKTNLAIFEGKGGAPIVSKRHHLFEIFFCSVQRN